MSVPQTAFIAGLLSPISYSYESDGSMESDEDMALGIKRAGHAVQYVSFGCIKPGDYQQYKVMILKDFLPSGGVKFLLLWLSLL